MRNFVKVIQIRARNLCNFSRRFSAFYAHFTPSSKRTTCASTKFSKGGGFCAYCCPWGNARLRSFSRLRRRHLSRTVVRISRCAKRNISRRKAAISRARKCAYLRSVTPLCTRTLPPVPVGTSPLRRGAIPFAPSAQQKKIPPRQARRDLFVCDSYASGSSSTTGAITMSPSEHLTVYASSPPFQFLPSSYSAHSACVPPKTISVNATFTNAPA